MCVVSGVSEAKSQNVSCATRLRDFVVWLGLHRMDQIRKFDRVLNEEDRDIVADQVPHALVGVELDRKAAYVPRRIGVPRDPATVENRRKTGVSLPVSAKQCRLVRSAKLVDLEKAMSRRPAACTTRSGMRS